MQHVPKEEKNKYINKYSLQCKQELQAFLKDDNDEHDTTSTGKVFHR